jgi:hypothetical protein
VIGVTPNTDTNRYTAGMRLVRLAKGFFAGLLTVALLSVAPASLTPPAHAEMNHGEGTASQGCAAGCMNNGPGVQIAISNHRNEEKQDKEPVAKEEPYYTQFFQFEVPRKLTSQYIYGASILRPPDLVILYANYRS